jgi:hypothetical protein
MGESRSHHESLPAHVEIGGVSKDALMQRLGAGGIQVNPIGMELFNDARFTVGPLRKQVPIACLTVADLGLPNGGTYSEVVRAAAAVRLVECPLEVGPHLRLAFRGQREGFVGRPSSPNTAPPGAITVASAPLDQEDSTPKGFYLRVIDGVPWLRGYRSWDGHLWNPDDAFVFARKSAG